MYEEYFKFSGSPFKLNPDPKFFFGSRSHNKAMAYLHYGLRQAEGFIVITGEIGAGKSMLISHLLDQLDRSRIAAAHLLTPNLKPENLLSHVLSAFRIEASGEGQTAALEAFEDYLFDQLNHGRRVLLIVDEAQNLPPETLEELRILSNMDFDGTPLFQVFLVGQPDFRPVLAGENMEQLRQRIIASYHLHPLSEEESINYIQHRLAVVGWKDNPSFADGALTAVHKATGGVPRKINKLCNRLLIHCSIEQVHEITGDLIKTIASDLADESIAKPAVNDVDKPSENLLLDAQSKKALLDGVKSQNETIDIDAEMKKAVNGPETIRDIRQNKTPVVVPFQNVRKVSTDDAKKKNNTATTQHKNDDNGLVMGVPPVVTRPDIGEGTMADSEVKKPADSPKKAEDPKPADVGQMSVLDRLRMQKSLAAENSTTKTKETTMHDVADAIAAVSTTEATELQNSHRQFVRDQRDGDLYKKDEVDLPAFEGKGKEWRQVVFDAVSDARVELRKAHSNMTRLRHTMKDSEKRRESRSAKIAASLQRAESILAEIREDK